MPRIKSPQSPSMSPELIVVAETSAEMRVRNGSLHSAAASIAPMQEVLNGTNAKVHPLFGATEERIRATARRSPWGLPDLATYYRIEVADNHEEVAAQLHTQDLVAGAYLKLPATLAEHHDPAAVVADTVLAAATSDFTGNQVYLNDAPAGVGATTEWSQPGGQGQGISVIVIAGAWQLGHEDLTGNSGAIGSGIAIDAVSYRNHGTALVGVVRADRNSIGTTGIAPLCTTREVATFGLGTSAAVKFAADQLSAGGIILIGWQRPGPGSTGEGSAGFLPIEWWPDDLAAIQYAAAKGVIVIEPAGNGSVSLDDPLYNTPLPGFPSTWLNPFDRTKADSGAVLIGAGAPPTGTHGRDHGPDRSRLGFSNYGASVDAQGWGAEVTTLGYGDLQGGADETTWYTDVFSGTSAAAAMVAGTVAALQGIELGGAKRPPLNGTNVRLLLRAAGNGAQQPTSSETADDHNIGQQPDLRNLVTMLTASKNETKDGKDAKDASKENKDNKDNKDTPEKLARDNKNNSDNKDARDDKLDRDSKHLHKEGFALEKIVSENVRGAPFAPPTATDNAAAVDATPARETPLGSDDPVRHFIVTGLRPDLSVAPLLDEPDYAGLGLDELTRILQARSDQRSSLVGS